jgi:hypothetical protein
MSNLEHEAIVRAGRDAIDAWRELNPLGGLDLSGADLSGASLNGCDLRGARLDQAHLEETELSGADLTGSFALNAGFEHGYLDSVKFDDANLTYADFTNSFLPGASFRSSSLSGTNFTNALVDGCTFAKAHMSQTVIGRCDFSRVKGIRSVRHQSASSIGVDTLILTLEGSGGQYGVDTLSFFERAGVPRLLLDYLPDLTESEPIQFVSCFISFGDDDRVFADRLYRDLKGEGFRCWKFDEDAIIGKETWANISQAISLHEKAIVICSQSGLRRPAVQREIERILRKEDRLKLQVPPPAECDVLVPIMLDGYILSEWKHPRQEDVTSKVIGDFRQWEDEKEYKKSLRKLKKSLMPTVSPRRRVIPNPIPCEVANAGPIG